MSIGLAVEEFCLLCLANNPGLSGSTPSAWSLGAKTATATSLWDCPDLGHFGVAQTILTSGTGHFGGV
ncbi:hypothetical protein, partial [Corynebacterium atrinae]